MNTSTPFKWRHFQADIISLCVRWYLRYPLSYRELEEMMLERGLHFDHTTIYRWVQYYAPELEKRCRPHLDATNDSWRVDETYVKVKKVWVWVALCRKTRQAVAYAVGDRSKQTCQRLWEPFQRGIVRGIVSLTSGRHMRR